MAEVHHVLPQRDNFVLYETGTLVNTDNSSNAALENAFSEVAIRKWSCKRRRGRSTTQHFITHRQRPTSVICRIDVMSTRTTANYLGSSRPRRSRGHEPAQSREICRMTPIIKLLYLMPHHHRQSVPRCPYCFPSASTLSKTKITTTYREERRRRETCG